MQINIKNFKNKSKWALIILNLVEQLKFKDKDGRWKIRLSDRGLQIDILKKHLKEAGCFSFFKTNSGEYLISRSQIYYFLEKGYKALKRGWTIHRGEYEVHHINGNVEDDRPHNLSCLSTADHQLVTKLVNNTVGLDSVCGNTSKELRTAFNSQGRPIKDWACFIKQIIAKSIYLTESWLKKQLSRKKVIQVKQAVQWVMDKIKSFAKDFMLVSLQDMFLSKEELSLLELARSYERN